MEVLNWTHANITKSSVVQWKCLLRSRKIGVAVVQHNMSVMSMNAILELDRRTRQRFVIGMEKEQTQLWVDVGMDGARRSIGACFVDKSKPSMTAKHSSQVCWLLVAVSTILGREQMWLNVGCTVCWNLDNQRRAILTDCVPGNETKTLNDCSAIGSLDAANSPGMRAPLKSSSKSVHAMEHPVSIDRGTLVD